LKLLVVVVVVVVQILTPLEILGKRVDLAAAEDQPYHYVLDWLQEVQHKAWQEHKDIQEALEFALVAQVLLRLVVVAELEQLVLTQFLDKVVQAEMV
jgi:ADP-dependent phosphofructokinase/glucokinase